MPVKSIFEKVLEAKETEKEEALKVAEKSKQCDADSEYNAELPVQGSQDSAAVNMGFEFGPFERGDKWRGANLPEGWYVDEFNEQGHAHIIDERGRARGNIYSKNFVHMTIIKRFTIGKVRPKDPECHVHFCIRDHSVSAGTAGRIILEETNRVPSVKQHPKVHKVRSKIYENAFNKKATKWLDERYPDWRRYDGHWDDEEENQEESKKKEGTPSDEGLQPNSGDTP